GGDRAGGARGTLSRRPLSPPPGAAAEDPAAGGSGRRSSRARATPARRARGQPAPRTSRDARCAGTARPLRVDGQRPAAAPRPRGRPPRPAGPVIRADALPADLLEPERIAAGEGPERPTLAALERRYIEFVLRETRGNQSRAAAIL